VEKSHWKAHLDPMKSMFALLIAASLMAAPPAPAETKPEVEEGLGLMERGLKLLFDNLLSEMEPALDEMAKAMKDLEPIARDLARMIGDVRYYDPPERLPNGDIIIRRKAGAPPPPVLTPEATPEAPQIDL
jgi:hypothetical protein